MPGQNPSRVFIPARRFHRNCELSVPARTAGLPDGIQHGRVRRKALIDRTRPQGLLLSETTDPQIGYFLRAPFEINQKTTRSFHLPFMRRCRFIGPCRCRALSMGVALSSLKECWTRRVGESGDPFLRQERVCISTANSPARRRARPPLRVPSGGKPQDKFVFWTDSGLSGRDPNLVMGSKSQLLRTGQPTQTM
jgi:hypothetical protein